MKKQQNKARLSVEMLESRQLMANNLMANLGVDGILKIDGTEKADTIYVEESGGRISVKGIKILSNGKSVNDVSTGQVSKIVIEGLGGNDTIDLNRSGKVVREDSEIHGGKGIDTIRGGNGRDTIDGDGDTDYLYGNGSKDTLNGCNGDDWLYGGEDDDYLWDGGSGSNTANDGNDHLYGGNGNDRLQGGFGNDWLYGDGHDDVLISLDGGIGDYLAGGTGADTFWVDLNGFVRDNVADLQSTDQLQAVASFANGADRTLDGDRIVDPTTKAGTTHRRFAGNPLFASGGPSGDDVKQQDLADCWLLAGLGAVAYANPQAIRQNVVDFGDGTYGVRLGNSFYRVDDDLAVVTNGTSPIYAGLGRENSMWVAVTEKAYAYYRTGANSYTSIEWGDSYHVYQAFRATNVGEKGFSDYSSAAALGNEIYAHWSNGEAVSVGFVGAKKKAAADDVPLIMGHSYTVVGVARNAKGVVTSITLRNPWGYDGAGDDGNSSDARVTVTPDQLFAHVSGIDWGCV